MKRFVYSYGTYVSESMKPSHLQLIQKVAHDALLSNASHQSTPTKDVHFPWVFTTIDLPSS